eukprot:2464056-Rhodomonas_salina.3
MPLCPGWVGRVQREVDDVRRCAERQASSSVSTLDDTWHFDHCTSYRIHDSEDDAESCRRNVTAPYLSTRGRLCRAQLAGRRGGIGRRASRAAPTPGNTDDLAD